MCEPPDSPLNEQLAKCRKAELVDWIVARTAEDETLRAAALELVSPRADARTLVAELRRTMSKAWARTRSSREPWKLAEPISADLEPVLTALKQLIARGFARDAEKLLRRFVEAIEAGLDEVDDSRGSLGSLGQEAVQLWSDAWSKIEPRDFVQLAKMVFDEVQNNGYGLRDNMIHDFADALGRNGLLALKNLLEAQHEARRTDKACDDWRTREPLRHLSDVADALGDVDMYIDLQRQLGIAEIQSVSIARRLLDAGRANEALEYLEECSGEHPHRCDYRGDSRSLRCDVLLALGRDDEARELLREDVRQNLDAAALDRLLALTREDQRPELECEAVAIAERHRDRLRAALFLLDQGETERAAALIVSNPEAFEREHYGFLLRLAEPLRNPHPAAAWILYRALMLDILEGKRSKAYHHAADYLEITQDLASRAKLNRVARLCAMM